MRVLYRWLFAGCLLLWLATCSAAPIAHASATIAAQYPHDPNAFTQGLLIGKGTLFESTGTYGQSTLRRVDLKTGRVLKSIALNNRYFGEGLALARGKLYQLTWKAGLAFVYDPDNLERIGQFRYAGEGWGLTWDGEHLIMSDGSATLRVIDPRDFTVIDRIHVTEDGTPLSRLNELEYVDGEILANVWYTNRIVRIDPASGTVVGSLDTGALRAALPNDGADTNVLNGIAWDATKRRLYLTGKDWPRLFEIRWPPRQSDPGITQ